MDTKEEAKMSGDTRKKDRVADANTLIASGVGIGVFGAAAAAISGAVCPLCIVAVPALVGVGVYKRWRARRPSPP